jgi:uncharacterized membrane protein
MSDLYTEWGLYEARENDARLAEWLDVFGYFLGAVLVGLTILGLFYGAGPFVAVVILMVIAGAILTPVVEWAGDHVRIPKGILRVLEGPPL